MEYRLTLRSQTLERTAEGCFAWRTIARYTNVAPERAAILVSDMWDNHWCPAAAARCAKLAHSIDSALHRARQRGVLILHAPSETMAHYARAPARLRFLDAGNGEAPPVARKPVTAPPPFEFTDAGCEGCCPGGIRKAWNRQHPAIHIDQAQDYIAGDGGERIYHCLRRQNRDVLIYMGVHTDRCVLHRSFGIDAMLGYGLQTLLVRDLTDALYNPCRPPYVTADEATALAIGYIEKFYCPTVAAEEL